MFTFVADDFTGSTDALEILSQAGLKTVLFTKVPSRETLKRYPDIEAFGVATHARSLAPGEMTRVLSPIFKAIKELSPRFVHYKVCSTFDSSPAVGSIGCALELGREIFETRIVPIVAGAPSLGRYCSFGNLFARFPTDGQIYRIDRHPSMSKHPTTPMNEGDLRIHLAMQTQTPLRACFTPELETLRGHESSGVGAWRSEFRGAILLDVVNDEHLRIIGRVLEAFASTETPLFTIGSSGVESAFVTGVNSTVPIANQKPKTEKPSPLLVIVGSCSPVTQAQINFANKNGFVVMRMDDPTLVAEEAIKDGKSVVIHSNASNRVDAKSKLQIGAKLSSQLLSALKSTKVARVVVAGGDTSGEIAQALGIESMQMLAPLVRGAPLVKVTAPGQVADGLEMCFKGGQVGQEDFFVLARG